MLGGMALVGCQTPATSTPTTMAVTGGQGAPVGPATMPVPSANQTEITLPSGPPPAAKDLTHVLSKDEPFFLNEPTADSKPVGMLKAGDKVLVVIPGATYSQVITSKGVSAYTVTDGLMPLGK